MKNAKACPKCSGKDILAVPGQVGAYGAGNNIIAGKTVFSAVLVNRYICCNCGYSEEWIDTEDMAKLKKKYSN